MLRKAFTPLNVRLMSITLFFVARAFAQSYFLSINVAPAPAPAPCPLIPYKNYNTTFPIKGQLHSLKSNNFNSSNLPGQWIGLIDCSDNVEAIPSSSAIAIVLGYPSLCKTNNLDNLSYPLFNFTDPTCQNIVHALGNQTINATIYIFSNDSTSSNNNNSSISNSTMPMDGGNNNYGSGSSSVLATYQTAMIVLYAVSGVVLGLFFLVVLTNIIKNRLRPSTTIVNNGNDGNNRNQPRGIARAVLESFPVYLFSLGGVNSSTPGDANSKNPIDSSEKGIKKEYNGDYIELETIPSPEDNIPDEQSNTLPNAQANETIPDGDSLEIKENPIITKLQESHTREISGTSTSSSNNITDEQLTCPICLGDFESGEELRILPCHHQYHTSCIDPWLLDISPLCPMCKADFTTWSIDVSANAPSDDVPSGSTISVDSSGDVNIQVSNNATGQEDNDDASSLASSNSPHAFPHFRWIKYLTTIRRAGRRRRRSRRPAARHSVDPSRRQENNNDSIVPGTIVEVNEGREARLYRATM